MYWDPYETVLVIEVVVGRMVEVAEMVVGRRVEVAEMVVERIVEVGAPLFTKPPENKAIASRASSAIKAAANLEEREPLLLAGAAALGSVWFSSIELTEAAALGSVWFSSMKSTQA